MNTFNNILIKDIDKAIDLIDYGLKLLNKNHINRIDILLYFYKYVYL